MKNNSYFILSREIFDSAIWRDDPHVLKLFIYLIGQGRFDSKSKKYPGFEIKRGELVSSLAQISENNEYMWHGALKKWSRQKVARMLDILVEQGYIILLSDTYGTHIRICNYERYQQQQNYKRTEVEQVWTPSGTGVDTNKQDKQDKQEKNDKKRKEEKQPYLDYVFLSGTQHQKLADKLGKKKLGEMIERVNNYIGIIGEKAANGKYKSHYHVILQWVKGDTKKTVRPKGVSL